MENQKDKKVDVAEKEKKKYPCAKESKVMGLHSVLNGGHRKYTTTVSL